MTDDRPTERGHRTVVDEAQPGTVQIRSGADPTVEQLANSRPTMAPDPALSIGPPPAIPAARYELGEEIARGGMGRVVEATDTLLGRTVALKEALGLDADSLRRFQRETRITARLEHPAIVPVHDAGTMPNGAPYYVMRKISGKPLEKIVAGASSIDDRLALVPHIATAANAIAHAHERGIVHRDIKPSNILVGDLGETVVIDWGLAKVIGEADEHGSSHGPSDEGEPIKTRAGIVFGTPGFMAPEQLRGAPVDERCDVYALGATLYHLLARKPPHHAKTADEMMKAAAARPPTPLVELVPGVPAELSTIVDKALAHDARERYQDARSLAEDLQRFLAGQLVASHHYSTREKLVRFIKRNRVPVMIGGFALVALAIVLTISVVRVVAARDRADEAADTARHEKAIAEEQRAAALDRLDKLTLAQARGQIGTNPTLAVAMVKPLVARHWREVRSIAAAARAAGVAWSLPASRKTESLEMSRDGVRVLAAGEDGVVRLHDLGARSTRTLSERGSAVAAKFADRERRVVLWHDRKVTVLDVGTGAQTHELVAPTKIADLEVAGTTVYWTDEHQALWQLELGAPAPREVALGERVTRVTPSPDGRWLALWGEQHLLLLDRDASAAPVEVITATTIDFDWSDDGTRFAALVDYNGEGLAITGGPASDPPLRDKRLVGNRRYIAYGPRERMYTIGATGIAIVPSNRARPIAGDPIGLREARGGTIVAGSSSGVLALAESGTVELQAPEGRIERLDASPRTPYVIAAVEHRLVVWNLDDVQPRILGEGAPQLARFVGNDRVLAAYLDDPARLYDLAGGADRELPQLVGVRDVAASPDGAACVLDAGGHAQLISGDQLRDLGEADYAAFVSPTQVLLGGERAGALRVHDVSRAEDRVLVKRPATRLLAVALARGSTPTVAAAFEDRVVWRGDLRGPGETLAVPAATDQVVALDGGRVLYPDQRVVRVSRSGAVEAAAELPRAITRLDRAGPSRALAFTERDGVFQLDFDDKEPAPRVTELDPLDRKAASVATEAGTIAVARRTAIEIVDPLVRYRWVLAGATDVAYTTPQISADGRRVLAQTGNGLLVWTLVVPDGAEATKAWLDAMTNAVPGGGATTGVLDWQ